MSMKRNGNNVTKKIVGIAACIIVATMCLICFAACGENTIASEEVDVDLSVLNSTMVYAKVYDIVTNPTAYLGKTIKAKGSYDTSYYSATQKYYNYVVIQDATACCAQGLEFECSAANYPTRGTEIEIIGVFKSYEELGITYYYIQASTLTVNP